MNIARVESVFFDEDGVTPDVASALWGEIATFTADGSLIERRYVNLSGVPWGEPA